MKKRATGLCLALLAAGSAGARDGVIEINQAVALAGGVNGDLAADPPGFPVRIVASGSYVLTSDLVVSNTTTDAIEIWQGGGSILPPLSVSLDLNGFAIRGPVTCTGEGPTLACTPSGGTGRAVWTSFFVSPMDSLVVRNGRIRGMPFGVQSAARTCLVRDLIAMNTGATNLSGACILLGSTFSFGPGNGVALTGRAIVADSLASANGGAGFLAGYAVLLRNAARENAGTGISNQAFVGAPLLVSNSTSSWNAFGGVLCTGNGIPCLLIDTSLSQNTLYQLDITGCNGGYTNTVIWTNGLGSTVDGGCTAANSLPPNLCNGSLTCP